jgi:putative MATE family efflux protein
MDTLMVSHISDAAVAGLGVATQVVAMAIICFGFVGVGVSVVLTHHLGAGDGAGARRIARAGIGVSFWVGLVVSAAVGFFSGPLLVLLQLPPALRPDVEIFLTLMGSTLFLEAQNIAMSAVLRAHGRASTVMLVGVGQNLINVSGNALILFGLLGMPRLGVPGVALSGIASRLVCFLALRGLLTRSTGVPLQWRDHLTLRLVDARRILAIGLPAVGANASYWLALMAVTSFTSRMGPGELATFAYSRQLTIWVVQFSVAIGVAAGIVVGHCVGAGEFERAHQMLLSSLRKGVLLAACTSVGLAAASPYLLGLFTQDPSILAGAVELQRLGVILEIGRVFNVVVLNGLRATGDTRFPLLVGGGLIWGIWVPLAWLLGLHLEWGLKGVWFAMICDEWLRGAASYLRWKRKGWLSHAIRARSQLPSQTSKPMAVAGGQVG